MNLLVKQLNRKVIKNQNYDEAINNSNKIGCKKETKKKLIPDITREKWFWDKAVLS